MRVTRVTLVLLALACAQIWHPASAAFKCAVCESAPADMLATTAVPGNSGGSESSGAVGAALFCPAHSWYVCLDAATPTTSWAAADIAAQAHFSIATKTISAAGIPTSKSCRDALRAWICAAHFPVCEASTHGRAVCDTEFAAVTELACPEVFGDQESSTAAAAAAAAARTSHGSAFNATEIATLLRAELAVAGSRNGSVVSEDQGSCVHLDYSGPNYWNWVIGFALCTVFAALSPLAFNLQKSSIMKNDALPLHEQRPVYKQPKWMCGVVVLISCSLVDFVAFGLAPQSLLTPLGAMVLVYNMIIASFYGEKVGRVEMVATGVISVGTLLCIVFADHYTPSYSFSDILALWYTSRMLWYIMLVPLFAAAHALPARWIVKNGLHEHPVSGPQYMRLLCFCYAGAAGIIGAQAILFAKQTMELLKAWGLGEPIWAHYEVYLILIGIPIGLVGNLSYLNAALGMFDALQVVPIYQTYWMIAGTLGGFVYFNELEEMDALAKGMFFLGAVISLVGIVILSSRRQPGGDADGDEKYGVVSGQETDESSDGYSSYDDESGSEEEDHSNGEKINSAKVKKMSGDLENGIELSSSVKETLTDLGVSTKSRKKKKKKKKKKKRKKRSDADAIEDDRGDTSSRDESGGRSRSPSDAVMVKRVSGAFVLTMSDSDASPSVTPAHSPRETNRKKSSF